METIPVNNAPFRLDLAKLTLEQERTLFVMAFGYAPTDDTFEPRHYSPLDGGELNYIHLTDGANLLQIWQYGAMQAFRINETGLEGIGFNAMKVVLMLLHYEINSVPEAPGPPATQVQTPVSVLSMNGVNAFVLTLFMESTGENFVLEHMLFFTYKVISNETLHRPQNLEELKVLLEQEIQAYKQANGKLPGGLVTIQWLQEDEILAIAVEQPDRTMALAAHLMQSRTAPTEPEPQQEFRVKSTYKFPNGMVATFDYDGKQIPDLQGPYTLALHRRIHQHSDSSTDWQGFPEWPAVFLLYP